MKNWLGLKNPAEYLIPAQQHSKQFNPFVKGLPDHHLYLSMNRFGVFFGALIMILIISWQHCKKEN